MRWYRSAVYGLALACFPLLGLAPAYAQKQQQIQSVQDVNTPGRVPYNLSVEFSGVACGTNCSDLANDALVWLVDAPAVPAGKRLVVQHISASLPAGWGAGANNNTDNNTSISFQSARSFERTNVSWYYNGPWYGSPNSIGMTSPAFFVVEPGQQPHLRVNLISPLGAFLNGWTGGVGSVTIGGYLIDAGN